MNANSKYHIIIDNENIQRLSCEIFIYMWILLGNLEYKGNSIGDFINVAILSAVNYFFFRYYRKCKPKKDIE